MRAFRLWPAVVALLLVAAFGALELRGTSRVRATFTLDGLG